MKYLLLLFVFPACGIHVSSDPIKVAPITVNPVTVTVSYESVQTYCTSSCVNNQDPTTCSTDCVNQFFNIFDSAVNVPGVTK